MQSQRHLLRASGKPSTWFPLVKHVQKAIIFFLWIFLFFFEIFIFDLLNSHYLKKFELIADFIFLSFLCLARSFRSFNMMRSYFFIIPNPFYMKSPLKYQRTRQILRFPARPVRCQCRASGKTSTWFPLGAHVQKAVIICFWKISFFWNVHL